jgi:gas vesicle protein
LDKQKLLIGLGVGLIIGGIAGLLLTPKSGKENRAIIVKTAKQMATKVKAVAKSARDIHGRFIKRKK